MPWPFVWSSPKKEDDSVNVAVQDKAKKAVGSVIALTQDANDKASSASKALPKELQAYTQPQTIIATVVLTTLCLSSYRFYRNWLRRIPEAGNIKPGFFRKRSIFGKVTSVGDGDNFRVYHTPGGLLAGWGWLPWRRIPVDKKELRNKTIHVRLAGIDAPELAHFGRPSQAHAQEALDWLTAYVSGRRVRAYVHKPDQYSRVVATVYIRKWLLRRDVGLQMLKAGMATVYEAKSGAEFGEGLEQKYRNAEWWAKAKRKGMWAGSKKDYESPREYKTRYGSGSPTEQAAETKK